MTFTPTTYSAPISRQVLTGTLLTSPPSTRYRPRTLTGVKMPGTEMLARTAVITGPVRITTYWPCTMSVATQAKGIFKSEKVRSPRKDLSAAETRLP